VRALVITRAGPPEVLRVEDRPEPEPGPGQVKVRVRAAGINFADTMARQGLYPDAPEPPSVVGYEFAGELESGERVLGGCRFGAYSEYVVTDRDNVMPLPDGWSFEEGAAMPVNYATAYAGLVRYGNVQEGERVLVHAAAGGVGIAATQVAKLLGAEVYGTASGSKHDAIRGFGVDHPIDYREQDFVKEVRRIAGDKQPLDLVMDAIGGSSFGKSFSLLRPGGRLVCFGASAFASGERRNIPKALTTMARTRIFHPMPLMSESKAVIGLNMLTLWDSTGSLDEWMEPLRRWTEQGKLKPVVAKAFPLEQGPDAHRYIAERRNIGKVVLTL
jgi:NADPH:quinone reductase-like Zn-dependent oxidoreductase